MGDVLLLEARKRYHQALVNSKVLTLSKDGVASNADSSNTPSKAIAAMVVKS